MLASKLDKLRALVTHNQTHNSKRKEMKIEDKIVPQERRPLLIDKTLDQLLISDRKRARL